VDGRLFLQRNEKGVMMWRQDTPGIIKRADASWPRLLEQYGSTVTEAQLTPRRELSLAAARQIAQEAHDHAMQIQAPSGSIAVVDAGGHLLYLERLDNTFAASAMVAYQKAQTAALFRMPSRKLEDAIVGGRTSLATTGYTMLQGGEPIFYRGQVVGAIGVSGTASAQQDEEVALAGRNAPFSPESAAGAPNGASTETRAAK
jgi:glc operon protein GlcG